MISIGYAVPLSAIFLLLTIPFYHTAHQKSIILRYNIENYVIYLLFLINVSLCYVIKCKKTIDKCSVKCYNNHNVYDILRY